MNPRAGGGHRALRRSGAVCGLAALVLSLTACGTHYESAGSARPRPEEFAGNAPSVEARCSVVDEKGGYGGDWFSADYLVCAEPRSDTRLCYGHTSLLYGDRWQLQGFDDTCRAAERAAVAAGDLPPRPG